MKSCKVIPFIYTANKNLDFDGLIIMAANIRGMRIAKYLSRAGICSRREAETLIAEGKISINDKIITSPINFVNDDSIVKISGKEVKILNSKLWIYHKEKGLVTTNRDEKNRATIFDMLPQKLPRVITVGRLDLNTEGLLLLTNDGELARKLELPENNFKRTYKVRIFGQLKASDIKKLSDGLIIDKIKYKPIIIKNIKTATNSWAEVTLQEGKNREIRKVFEYLGYQVSRLIRIKYGPFSLDNLSKGSVLEIPYHKIKHLLRN